MGVTRFYDTEIRPALPGIKGVAYGMMIGAAMAKPQAWLAKVAPGAQLLSLMDEAGSIDVELIAQLLKDQIKMSGGKIEFEIGINPMNAADKDKFAFSAADVDKLIGCIESF